MKVLVLNGPNLGRLGKRQPEIYGATTYDELVSLCEQWGAHLGLDQPGRDSSCCGLSSGLSPLSQHPD